MKGISINISEFYYLPWPEWLDHVKSFGIDMIEVSYNVAKDQAYVESIASAAKSRGMKISSTHHYFHFFAPNDAQGIRDMQDLLIRDLEYTRILGSDRLVWYTGVNEIFTGDKAVIELMNRLYPVIAKARELGIILLLETEFAKAGFDLAASVPYLKQFLQLANSPYVACNFDPANIYVAGAEPYPYAYEELKPWIKHVHIKDVHQMIPQVHQIDQMPGLLQAGQIDACCCAAGQGGLNMSGFLQALKDDAYDGYLTLELHMKKEYKDETLHHSLDYLRNRI